MIASGDLETRNEKNTFVSFPEPKTTCMWMGLRCLPHPLRLSAQEREKGTGEDEKRKELIRLHARNFGAKSGDSAEAGTRTAGDVNELELSILE
jgi:hypothetical protein